MIPLPPQGARWLVLAAAASSLAFRPYQVEQLHTAPAPAPTVTAERFPGADAVVLEEEASISPIDTAKPELGYRWTESTRLKVLTPAGRYLARVSVGGSRDVELVSVRGRAYSGPNDVRNVSGKPIAFFGDAEPLSPMYSDRYSGFFDVPGVETGDIVEYRVEYRRRGPGGLPGWHFDRFDVPVIESRLVLALPADWRVEHALRANGRPASIEPTKEATKDGVRWTFTERDLPPIEEELLGPSRPDLGRLLHYTVLRPGDPAESSWDSVAEVYRRLSAELPPLPEGALAHARIEDRSTRGIFEWVRDHLRYVAIHEGLGALRPHAPKSTLINGWGDCKDMTHLLIALYAQAGIEAHPVLVATAAMGRAKPALPRVAAFDHVIVGVPRPDGGVDLLDPTAKHLAFGELAPALQGQPGLVVLPGGGSVLIELPWMAPRRWSTTWTIGPEHITLTAEADGEQAGPWRGWSALSSRAQRRAARGLLADPEAARVETTTISEAGDRVRIDARYRDRGVTTPFESGRMVVLGKLLPSAGELRVPRDRVAPVELGPPREVVESVTLLKAPGETLVHAPTPLSWSAEGIGFELVVTDTVEAVTVERRFRLEVPRLPPERFADLSRLAELLYQSSVDAVHVRGPASVAMTTEEE